MTQKRSDISDDDKWNMKAFYSSSQEWSDAFTLLMKNKRNDSGWSKIMTFKGKLHDSHHNLQSTLKEYFSLSRELTKLYTYTQHRYDENLSDDDRKGKQHQIAALYHDFINKSAWLEPEILSFSDNTIRVYSVSKELKEYKFYLETLFRMKKHTLSKEKEELIALAALPLSTPQKAFSVLNNADFSFGRIKDTDNIDKELTHGSYQLFLRNPNQEIRKNAFNTLHNKYFEYENTITELLNGHVQCHLFNMRARHYQTCLEASLYPKNIDVNVYHNLIKTVRDNLGSLHRYISLRKKLLNLKELHLYDMYVPLSNEKEKSYSYEEAENMVIESVAPLGTDYQTNLRQGLKKEGWVDRFENENKRSGAYSGGCYDSFPYILLNYKGTLNDVFTLAHEAGHSMHSLLSRRSQPYCYANYPIFVAEVASTFNEELLWQYLFKRSKNNQEKIDLINHKLDNIRATLFRQTQFAEFELLLHQFSETDIPLTPTLLKKEYDKLNQLYFGKDTVIDPVVAIEWARIPHFYSNFYVYQYATGISAALALSKKILDENEKDQQEYLSFLKTGGHHFPLELLKIAGVDMCSPKPILSALQIFDSLIDELSQLHNITEGKENIYEKNICD